jgi:oligopeptide/dipeptide ABC transporter ATP-binding protein
MTGRAAPVLALQQLGVTLPSRDGGGHVAVLEQLDLVVREGEMTALVGESGSGKTIAALAAMRLLPPGARISGRVLFGTGAGAEDLLALDERQMRRRRGSIGMVFQNPLSALNPSMTIGRQVAEGHRLHSGAGAAAARRHAIELLGEVGIPNPSSRLDDYPHQFSGGQRQRVMIAAALACAPKLLIADEPTTGLDPLVARQILQLLAKLRVEHRMGLLFITHDLSIVEEYAQSLTVLYAGRAVEWGEAGRFFAAPRHPYSQALLAAVPRLGQAELNGIPGTLPEPGQRPRGCRFAPRCPQRRPDCSVAYPPPIGDAEEAAACLYPRPAPRLAPRAAGAETDRADDPGTALLRLEEVTVRYGGRATLFGAAKAATRPSLDRVSLHLRRGECLGIVGESGSGKSTLGRAILHMLRTEGRILLDGRPLAGLPAAERRRERRRVQVVFQDPRESLNPRMRIGAIIAEALVLGGLRERNALRRQAAALLERVGLNASLADRLPHAVSGGQAQRIAVARALAARPDIIVLDEPTSALDVSTQAMLLTLLKDLSRDEHLAYVMISHDIAAVSWLADRIAVLRDGRIVEMAPAARLITAPADPYSAALIATAPRLDQDAPVPA